MYLAGGVICFFDADSKKSSTHAALMGHLNEGGLVLSDGNRANKIRCFCSRWFTLSVLGFRLG